VGWWLPALGWHAELAGRHLALWLLKSMDLFPSTANIVAFALFASGVLVFASLS